MTFLEWLKSEGKALVIQGPQGCGKTLLAKQLAGEASTYSCVPLSDVTGPRPGRSLWLGSRPKTVIFEGAPKIGDFESVKYLITSTVLAYHPVGGKPETIDNPTFIFCTSDPQPLSFGVYDRRFYVIKMDAKENKLWQRQSHK